MRIETRRKRGITNRHTTDIATSLVAGIWLDEPFPEFPETPEICGNALPETPENKFCRLIKCLYNGAGEAFGRYTHSIFGKYLVSMQKHPLLSVKQAAEMLRLDERSVRERLINGQLKGEKKSVGLREKWFVYSGSVEAAVAKQGGAFTVDSVGASNVTVDAESQEVDFTPGPEDTVPEASSDNAEEWIELNRDKVKILAEEIVKPLMEKIEAQAELIFEQKRTISEQDRQLRLLPDLQKQAESSQKDVELKHVENEALKKQIAALQEQVEASKRSWWQKLFQPGPSQ